MFMNLWVKNTLNGIKHQVGTNIFDSLEFIDGRVEYVNTRTNGGTHDGDYIFIDPPSPLLDLFIDSREMAVPTAPVHLVIHKTQKTTQDNNGESSHN